MGQHDRVQWRGVPMTRRQRQAFIATEGAIRRETKYKDFRFTAAQGSWQPQTTYSGTSHTKAAVVDLEYDGIAYGTNAEKVKYRTVLRYLRKVGRQAAFGRGPWNRQIDGSGAMPLHFHTVDLDTTGAADSAIWQAGEYRRGNNGLVAGQRDTFPYRPDPIREWQYAA